MRINKRVAFILMLITLSVSLTVFSSCGNEKTTEENKEPELKKEEKDELSVFKDIYFEQSIRDLLKQETGEIDF